MENTVFLVFYLTQQNCNWKKKYRAKLRKILLTLAPVFSSGWHNLPNICLCLHFTHWKAPKTQTRFLVLVFFFFWSLVFISAMGGGNGQKAKTARERNMEKQKAAKGIPSFYSLLVYAIIIIKLQTLLDLWLILVILASLRKPAWDQQEGHDHPGTLFCLTSSLIGFKIWLNYEPR